MGTAVWLAAPYVSMLVVCRWRPVARRVAERTAQTLPLGWAAVLALFAALVGLWSPPLAVLVVCAALSGLAMLTPGPGGPDDGPRAGGDMPPEIDWARFDELRSRWANRRPSRSPA